MNKLVVLFLAIVLIASHVDAMKKKDKKASKEPKSPKLPKGSQDPFEKTFNMIVDHELPGGAYYLPDWDYKFLKQFISDVAADTDKRKKFYKDNFGFDFSNDPEMGSGSFNVWKEVTRPDVVQMHPWSHDATPNGDAFLHVESVHYKTDGGVVPTTDGGMYVGIMGDTNMNGDFGNNADIPVVAGMWYVSGYYWIMDSPLPWYLWFAGEGYPLRLYKTVIPNKYVFLAECTIRGNMRGYDSKKETNKQYQKDFEDGEGWVAGQWIVEKDGTTLLKMRNLITWPRTLTREGDVDWEMSGNAAGWRAMTEQHC